jgi:hypothetical protein
LEIRNVLPRFAQLVQGFGIKFNEDEKVRAGCLTPLCLGEGISKDPQCGKSFCELMSEARP